MGQLFRRAVVTIAAGIAGAAFVCSAAMAQGEPPGRVGRLAFTNGAVSFQRRRLRRVPCSSRKGTPSHRGRSPRLSTAPQPQHQAAPPQQHQVPQQAQAPAPRPAPQQNDKK